MKRTAIFVAALACGFAAQAQQTQLEKDLKQAGAVRDSIAVVLAKHRADYAVQDESARKKMAPTIVALEDNLHSAQRKYDAILAEVMSRDAKRVVASYDGTVKADAGVKTEVVAKAVESKAEPKVAEPQTQPQLQVQPQPQPQVVQEQPKPVVEEKKPELSFADRCKNMLNDQQGVDKIKELVDQYLNTYNELKKLHGLYKNAQTKIDADKVLTRFVEEKKELATLDAELTKLWQDYYYKRIFDYKVLAEESDMSNMPKFSDAQVQEQIKVQCGKYISDALIEYYIGRKALLEYEKELVTWLLKPELMSSVQSRIIDLNSKNYQLEKLELERRNFIRYENIISSKDSARRYTGPIPQTQVEDYGTVYRIQIMEHPHLMSYDSSYFNFKMVAPVSYLRMGQSNKYSYFAGGFRTAEEANKSLKAVKAFFRAAKVVVWVDGRFYDSVDEMIENENRYIIKISGVQKLPDGVEEVLRKHNDACEIKRDGAVFVASEFVGSEELMGKIVEDIKSLDTELVVEIEKQNLK